MSRIAGALQSEDAHLQESSCDSDSPDLLNQLQVCRKLGISYQTWIRWRKAQRTPTAVTLPSGRLKWRREDIDALAGRVTPRISRAFRSVRPGRSQQLVAIHRSEQSVAAEVATQPERLAK